MNDSRPPEDEIAANDRDLAARVARELDASVDALDAATLSRLNQARQRALAEVAYAPWRRRWIWPAAFAAAASVVMAVAWLPRGAVSPPLATPVASVQQEDLDLLATGDSLDMYEDLEFYAWLESQPADG